MCGPPSKKRDIHYFCGVPSIFIAAILFCLKCAGSAAAALENPPKAYLSSWCYPPVEFVGCPCSLV